MLEERRQVTRSFSQIPNEGNPHMRNRRWRKDIEAENVTHDSYQSDCGSHDLGVTRRASSDCFVRADLCKTWKVPPPKHVD